MKIFNKNYYCYFYDPNSHFYHYYFLWLLLVIDNTVTLLQLFGLSFRLLHKFLWKQKRNNRPNKSKNIYFCQTKLFVYVLQFVLLLSKQFRFCVIGRRLGESLQQIISRNAIFTAIFRTQTQSDKLTFTMSLSSGIYQLNTINAHA